MQEKARRAEWESNAPVGKEDRRGDDNGNDDNHNNSRSSSGSESASLVGSTTMKERQQNRCSVRPGLCMSATTLLPAVGPLLFELSSLIQEPASATVLPVPQSSPSRSNDLVGSFGPAPNRHLGPICPQFPTVMAFLAEAAAEPAKGALSPPTHQSPGSRGLRGRVFSLLPLWIQASMMRLGPRCPDCIPCPLLNMIS